MKKLLFLDLETGGLDPSKDPILEVAAFIPADNNLACFRVSPGQRKVTPEAAAVNGYDEAKWGFCLSHWWAMSVLQNAFCSHDYILCGHNVRFDFEFLTSAFSEQAMSPPRVDHHFIDTAALAVPLLLTGEVKSLSLSSLCEHFQTPHRPKHSAMSDVLSTVDLFEALMDRLGFGSYCKEGNYVL